MSNEGLRRLAAGSPRLRRLTLAAQQYNIFLSTNTTQDGLVAFRAARPEVQLLRVS